tara:strand:- start:18857 stop:19009 length:153 start_codon:yes stop_codon:yes gene_type:complete
MGFIKVNVLFKTVIFLQNTAYNLSKNLIIKPIELMENSHDFTGEKKFPLD